MVAISHRHTSQPVNISLRPFVKARDRVQGQVIARLWLTTWIGTVPTNLGVIAVYAYNEEFFAIRREVKNGMLSPVSYMIANLGIQVPLMFILCAFASISAYGILDFNGDKYFAVLVVHAINLWVYERIAQLLSISFDNSQGPGRKPGASLYTRKRFSLSLSLSITLCWAC